MAGPHIPEYGDLTEIAQGASSVVYQADDPAHSRQVAIKVLKATQLTEEDREAFRREVSAMGQLSSHPHIVDLIGSGFLDTGRPYIVMPFYKNGTYGKLVDEQGPLDWRQVVDFGVKIASALETAHRRGYIHRDIKPANIYRSEFAGQPVLADFGVSSFVSPSLEGMPTVTVAGTPIYCAPEVLNGVRPTVLSDLYSLGATLYGLIEGRPAFADASVSTVVALVTSSAPPPALTAEAPDDLAALVMKLLAKQPDDRPRSALEVVRDLNAIQRDNGLLVTPPLLRTEDQADRSADEVQPRGTDRATDRGTDRASDRGTDRASDRGTDKGTDRGTDSGRRSHQSTGLSDRPTMTVQPLDRATQPLRSTPSATPRLTPVLSPRPGWRAPILVGLVALAAIAAYAVYSGADPTGGGADPEAGLVAEAIDRRWSEDAQLVTQWMAHDGPVDGLSWSVDDRQLATGGRDRALRVWSVDQFDQPGADPTAQLQELDSWILDLAWAPDGLTLAAADATGGLLFWDLSGPAGPSETTFAPAIHDGPAEAVAWNADGTLLASGGADGLIRLTAPDGIPQRTVGSHQQGILSLDWPADEPLPTSGAKDGTARAWDDDGGSTMEFSGHLDWVRSVEWNPQLRFLATSGSDRSVRIWSGSTGEEVHRLDLDSDPLGSITWSPDGRLLAIGGEDGSVLLWNGSEQTELVSASGPEQAVTGLAWSAVADLLAVARVDGTVEIHRAGSAS
jgi:serine/threonine protein kinase